MPRRRRSGAGDGSPRGEVFERTVHDLKNPLAVVRSALEWLEVELDGRADALDAIRDASSAATRLLSIVDDLDALAHLEHAGVVSAPMELTMIIGQVTAAAATRLATGGLSVTSSAPLELSTSGDAGLLGRALHALIDACARGAPSGTCIELQARLSGDEPSPALIEIEIGQQGTEPAAPESAALQALGSGGLGVYLALQVARAHGGSLMVIPTATMPRAVLRIPR